MSEKIIEKLRNLFEDTIESDLKYEGDLKNIDYCSLMYKAAAKDSLHTLYGSNLCMFNYRYDNNDAILMLFSVPVNKSDKQEKHITERIMEIIRSIETCFITVDCLKSEEVKEDRFTYILAIKKV